MDAINRMVGVWSKTSLAIHLYQSINPSFHDLNNDNNGHGSGWCRKRNGGCDCMRRSRATWFIYGRPTLEACNECMAAHSTRMPHRKGQSVWSLQSDVTCRHFHQASQLLLLLFWQDCIWTFMRTWISRLWLVTLHHWNVRSNDLYMVLYNINAQRSSLWRL